MPRRPRAIAPRLQWMVMCQAVLVDPSGPVSLVQTFDTVNAAGLPAMVGFTISSLFRGGTGAHKGWVTIEAPDGSVETGPESDFFLFNTRSAHRIDGRFDMALTQEGTYWFAQHLDGKELMRIPLSVAVARQDGPQAV